MPTLFTKIINGEIPCYRVAETERFLAFLDINPNTQGHTLCIPKWEVNKIFDMQEDDYLELMNFARKVAKSIEQTVDCERVGMAVVGLEVPHTHVHLIPINTMDDMRFTKKATMSDNAFQALAKDIQAQFIHFA